MCVKRNVARLVLWWGIADMLFTCVIAGGRRCQALSTPPPRRALQLSQLQCTLGKIFFFFKDSKWGAGGKLMSLSDLRELPGMSDGFIACTELVEGQSNISCSGWMSILHCATV